VNPNVTTACSRNPARSDSERGLDRGVAVGRDVNDVTARYAMT
jgi:hypothetical protein